MGFGTKQAREAQQSDRETVRRTVAEIESDAPPSQSAPIAPATASPSPATSGSARPTAASFFMKSSSPPAPASRDQPSAPVAASPGRPSSFSRPQAQAPATAAGRPRAFGGSAPPAPSSPGSQAGGFRASPGAVTQVPAPSIPMPAPRGLQQLRLDRLIEEVAKVRGVSATALQEMISKANSQPQAARVAFEQAYRDEVLPLRENMVRDMASARSQNPDAVVFLLSDPQNKKSRVIVLDQADAQSKGLNLLDNATLVCQASDYTPFARPAEVFGEGRGLSDDATQQEARRAPRP